MKRIFSTSFALFILIALTLMPMVASARPWKGVMPGVTTRNEVIKKLGVPSQDLPQNGLLYQGNTAPEGTKQVQVIFDANGVVTNIHVFPKTDLNQDQIKNTYGHKNFTERMNDSFKTYYHYKDEGIVVYFKEGNLVASITFQKPSRAPTGEEAVVRGEATTTTPAAATTTTTTTTTTTASPVASTAPSASPAATVK